MSKLADWLTGKIKDSEHKDLIVSPCPKVEGGGDEILVTVGHAPDKVVYLGSRHNGDTMRVGFAAKDRWANEEVEDAVESNGGTMTEFLEDEMEADDELEFEVQHFHESGWFHFACDIPKSKDFFESDEGKELIWYYFDGYARGVLPHAEGDDED